MITHEYFITSTDSLNIHVLIILGDMYARLYNGCVQSAINQEDKEAAKVKQIDARTIYVQLCSLNMT